MTVTILGAFSKSEDERYKFLFYLKNNLIEPYEYLYFSNTVMQ